MASRPDQPWTRRVVLVVVALVALVAVACGDNQSDETGDTTGSTGSGKLEGLVRTPPLEVGDLTLPEVQADGSSQPFTFRASPGKLLFVAFGYTNCPDVCPTTLSDIRKAIKALGSQGSKIEVAFATVDPERDTPEVITAYLGSFVDGGHPLRSEDTAEFQAAQDGFGVTSEVVKQADGSVEVAHTARSYIVDDAGRVAVEWAFGTSYKAMAGDLRILLADQGS